MTDYRCYFLNAARHIVGVENITGCTNDAKARTRAITLWQARSQYGGVAVWERSRKVVEELISKAG
jgi:hypothetical protein